MHKPLLFDQLPEAVSQLNKKLEIILKLLYATHVHQPIETPEHFLTIKEAAQFLRLTVPTIYSKVSKRELPVMKRGKRLYFSSNELLEYLKEGRKKTNSEIEIEAVNYLSKKKST